MVERLVPDELWELFQQVVPEAPTRPQGGGRRGHGDRQVLAAIIFVATTGYTWAQLPPVFGPSAPTTHRRFTEWPRARVGARLHRVLLDELGARGEADWSRCAIDSVNMRALKGPKIHLITDRAGLPLSIAIFGANTHGSQALQPLVGGTAPIRSRRGPRRHKPGKLHGDKGYDYDHLRRWLCERGIVHRLARKGVESSKRLGRHRWQVERTMAWPSGCRRLHHRYERRADHFLAFAGIACTLICYRRLTK